MRRFIVMAAVPLWAACSEAPVIGPELPAGCGAPRACQVAGVDLVLEQPVLLEGPRGTDAVTGYPIYEPGSTLSYVIQVWNRGDRASGIDTIDVHPSAVAVPPLQPGEVFIDTLQYAVPTHLYFLSDTARFVAEIRNNGTEQIFFGNDARFSPRFIVPLPVLTATLVFPDTVREDVPFTATVAIHNSSRFAASTPMAMAFCMFDFDVGCGSWAGEAFHLMELPAIAAGATWSASLMITIPPIIDRNYAGFEWDLVACLKAAGTPLDAFNQWQNRTCIGNSRSIRVLARAS